MTGYRPAAGRLENFSPTVGRGAEKAGLTRGVIEIVSGRPVASSLSLEQAGWHSRHSGSLASGASNRSGGDVLSLASFPHVVSRVRTQLRFDQNAACGKIPQLYIEEMVRQSDAPLYIEGF
ncbi:hypothetical protein RYA05_21430 [Pseudomonas syringae pv. actinidiae]|uniref:Phosphoserine phosphatase n=1 Tax=Pseudomonas syringae pv. actinidiae TaxID=103796 RepID=A0A2V0QHG0_PSESF|nr:hypothetical protein [Pseudomonas syringae]MBL3603042.1 hypothetical protein [Pseudomonas syringae pv. actinidiae]MBL3632382.1 hypothetical protein [Pseudomonas syringae pv. actinidiae]MBL3663720.1 hypothetical protein [Pseudomonas syringae pv. actinidiae]MCQ4651898.1 hypothetical protein [Pseudomonas syringae]MDG6413716.1 hypothetical protein [Pseudomonas syringae pv. actinidiae]